MSNDIAALYATILRQKSAEAYLERIDNFDNLLLIRRDFLTGKTGQA